MLVRLGKCAVWSSLCWTHTSEVTLSCVMTCIFQKHTILVLLLQNVKIDFKFYQFPDYAFINKITFLLVFSHIYNVFNSKIDLCDILFKHFV